MEIIFDNSDNRLPVSNCFFLFSKNFENFIDAADFFHALKLLFIAILRLL